MTPLNKLPSGGVTINLNGANIMDDYGVDRMMDRDGSPSLARGEIMRTLYNGRNNTGNAKKLY